MDKKLEVLFTIFAGPMETTQEEWKEKTILSDSKKWALEVLPALVKEKKCWVQAAMYQPAKVVDLSTATQPMKNFCKSQSVPYHYFLADLLKIIGEPETGAPMQREGCGSDD